MALSTRTQSTTLSEIVRAGQAGPAIALCFVRLTRPGGTPVDVALHQVVAIEPFPSGNTYLWFGGRRMNDERDEIAVTETPDEIYARARRLFASADEV